MSETAEETSILADLGIGKHKFPCFDDCLEEAVRKSVSEAHILLYSDIINPFLDVRLLMQEPHAGQGTLPTLVLRAAYTFGNNDTFHDMPVTGIRYLDTEDEGMTQIVAAAHAEGAVKLYSTIQEIRVKNINISSIDDRTLIQKTQLKSAKEEIYANRTCVEDAVAGYLNSLRALDTTSTHNYRILFELKF